MHHYNIKYFIEKASNIPVKSIWKPIAIQPENVFNTHNLSTFPPPHRSLYTKYSNKNHLVESRAIYQAILSDGYYKFCSFDVYNEKLRYIMPKTWRMEEGKLLREYGIYEMALLTYSDCTGRLLISCAYPYKCCAEVYIPLYVLTWLC